MKHLKITAAVIAAAAVLTAAPFPASAAAELPAWAPTDYRSAQSFRNTYGDSYAADGVICIVFKEQFPDSPDAEGYEITASGDGFTELDRQIYPCPDSTPGRVTQYEVVLWRAEKPGECTVDIKTEGGFLHPFTFAADADGNVQQTDFRSWLPDCAAEYNEYVHAHGEISTHGRFMVFAIDEGVGTAYHWEEGGTSGARLYEKIGCSFVTDELLVGGSQQYICVYEYPCGDAKADVNITWNLVDYSGTQTLETKECDFIVLDQGTCALMPGDARITLRDYDTDALIDFADYPAGAFKMWVKTNYNDKSNDPHPNPDDTDWTLTENPAVNRLASFYFDEQAADCSFGLDTEALPANLMLTWDGTEISYLENKAMDVTLRLQDRSYIPTFMGDVTGDGQCSLADVVAMVKWLLHEPGAELKNWVNGDFNHDRKIDARDLSRLKYAVMQTETPPPPGTEQTAKMLVTASYDGYGVAGQYLGGGERSTAFTVKAGDVFTERMNGVWVQNPEKDSEAAKLMEITAITDDGVTYLDYTRGEFPAEHTLPFGEKSETLWSTPEYTVFDGINYSYRLTFAAG